MIVVNNGSTRGLMAVNAPHAASVWSFVSECRALGPALEFAAAVWAERAVLSLHRKGRR